MPVISLTDFVDVVSKSGTSKATKVSTMKNRNDYSPATDFYKGIRDAIVDAIEHGKPKSSVDRSVLMATEKRKGHYQEVVDGFKKWYGRKNLSWFKPPRGLYGEGIIQVKVNPELGVFIDNVPHLIKLYFKTDKLPKNHALVSTHLMQECLLEACPEGTIMSILDTKRSNLMEYTAPKDRMNAALIGELAYIASLWDTL